MATAADPTGTPKRTNLGKIVPTPIPAKKNTHAILDIVAVNGRAYISRKDNNTAPVTDTEAWLKLTENDYDMAVRLGLFSGTEAEWIASLSAASEQAADEARAATEDTREATAAATLAAGSATAAATNATRAAGVADNSAEASDLAAEEARSATAETKAATSAAIFATNNATSAASSATAAAETANNSAAESDLATEAARSATEDTKKATASATLAASNATSSSSSASVAAQTAQTSAEETDLVREQALAAVDILRQMIEEGRSEILNMQAIQELVISDVQLSPSRMEVEFPARITITNTVAQKIDARIFPSYLVQNILFQQPINGGDSVAVNPDGSLEILKCGKTRIHVIAANNTKLYRTIEIEVKEPGLRLTKGGGVRFNSDGSLRLE